MQISSKCTYIFDAGFCSLLWHNMQKPFYVCLRWRRKEHTEKKDMHCCGECKGKGTANHFEAELNPQVPPVRNALTRDQEKNWTVNLSIFYRVSVYNPFGFLCQIALVRPYCCDIVQSSLVNHHNHSFSRRIKLANCFQPPALLGITNTCPKPAPYIIMLLYKLPRFYNAYATSGGYNDLFHSRSLRVYP